MKKRGLTPPAFADTNEDRSLSVFSQDGDLVVVTNATGQRRQITKTTDAETNPHFLADGHRITFQRGGNLFLLSLDNGDLEQLTDIRTAAANPDGQHRQALQGEGRWWQRRPWRRRCSSSSRRGGQRNGCPGVSEERTARDVRNCA